MKFWYEAIDTLCNLVPIPRYLVQNLDWLEEQLGEFDDDYILFDCPGNIYSQGGWTTCMNGK